jgi:hypothetical protein
VIATLEPHEGIPIAENDINSRDGLDLVEPTMAVFEDVRPAMNQCMQVPV